MKRTFPIEAVALFLDFDGTLAAIEERPDRVRPSQALIMLLDAAKRGLDGRLAVITGRALSEIDRMLQGVVTLVAGSHGLERRCANGVIERPARPHALDAAADMIVTYVESHHGLLIEDKGLSIAIHYRALPSLETEVRALAQKCCALGALETQEGKMVCEVRMIGPDKGAALERFLAEPPCEGKIPIFIGDDLTDEVAFVCAVRHNGFGMLVGQARKTAAAGRLNDPAAVLNWIETSLARGRFEIGG